MAEAYAHLSRSESLFPLYFEGNASEIVAFELINKSFFVNKRASVNSFLLSNLKENLKHVGSPEQFGSVD